MYNNKKFFSFAVLGLFSMNLAKGGDGVKIEDNFKQKIEDKKVEFQQKIENKIEDKKQKIEKIKDGIATLKEVKITAIEGSVLTVDSAGTPIKVNVLDKTNLVRKFGGKSTVSEFSVGNTVSVMGKWTDDTKTTVDAKVIRNESIQKRKGTFFGEIKSINGDKIVITTIHRDEQIVTVGSAKIENRKEVAITLSDLAVGHKIRVKGMWDNSNNTITEVKQIKDFNLPERPVKSPSPSTNP